MDETKTGWFASYWGKRGGQLDSEQQLRNWVTQYTERLVRLACTYVRDQATAEDCVQDAFLKAYKSMSQLQNKDDPFPWLVRIVINECKSFHRRGWREILTSVLPEATRGSTEETVLRRTRDEDLRNAVLSLPEKYRSPLILFYFEGLSSHDVAEILATNTGTVRTRLNRGREKLRKLLREGDGDRTGIAQCKTGV